MAITPVEIRQHDTLQDLDYTLVDSALVAHDLTGATVKFSMSSKPGITPKVNLQSVALVDATNGQVRYTWQTGDTSNIGTYYGEFQVTFSSGKILTFPKGSYIIIKIISDVA